MSLLRRVRLWLFGPDKKMLQEPAPPPQPILSNEQRQRLRLELQVSAAQRAGDEVIMLTRAIPEPG